MTNPNTRVDAITVDMTTAEALNELIIAVSEQGDIIRHLQEQLAAAEDRIDELESETA